MSNELKPCPFCSGEAKHVRAASAYHVFCSECASDVMVSTAEAMTTCQVNKLKLKAFDKWNTRADSERVSQLESELQAKTDLLSLVIEEKQKLIDDKGDLIETLSSLVKFASWAGDTIHCEYGIGGYIQDESITNAEELLERMK